MTCRPVDIVSSGRRGTPPLALPFNARNIRLPSAGAAKASAADERVAELPAMTLFGRTEANASQMTSTRRLCWKRRASATAGTPGSQVKPSA